MRQIIAILTAEGDPPPALDGLVVRFTARLRSWLEDIAWSEGNGHRDSVGPILAMFNQLEEAGRVRLLLDPEFYQAIHGAYHRRSADDLDQLRQVVMRLGTSSLDKPTHREVGPEEAILGDTIMVDYGTAFGRRVDDTSPVFMRGFDPMSMDERDVATRKLELALAEIDESAPVFGRLIRNYTRRIFVRKVGGLLPASEQVDTELGAIRLRNVHDAGYGHVDLVYDLIHESTHNLLATHEVLEFPFLPFGTRQPDWVRPVSPWSRRPIQTLPFVHACFVYFAMYHYAQRQLMAAAPGSAAHRTARERRARYASGFLVPGRLSGCVASLATIDPRVGQAIDWMEAIITRSAGLQQPAAASLGHRGPLTGKAVDPLAIAAQ